MVKTDKIEIRCSTEVRNEFDKFCAEMRGDLRRMLRRRVSNEDVIWYVLEFWKQNPQLFKQLAGPQVR